MRHHLSRLYAEQLSAFERDPKVVGAFFWTLRMGSGWDPRPSSGAPRGRQVEGSSAHASLPDFPFRIWSLLEMAKLGIATPLDRSYGEACGAHAFS